MCLHMWWTFQWKSWFSILQRNQLICEITLRVLYLASAPINLIVRKSKWVHNVHPYPHPAFKALVFELSPRTLQGPPCYRLTRTRTAHKHVTMSIDHAIVCLREKETQQYQQPPTLSTSQLEFGVMALFMELRYEMRRITYITSADMTSMARSRMETYITCKVGRWVPTTQAISFIILKSCSPMNLRRIFYIRYE